MAARTFADLRKSRDEFISYMQQEVADLKKHRANIEEERKKITKRIAEYMRKIRAWKKN